MRRYRNIIPDEKSLKQPYEYCQIGLSWSFIGLMIALNISSLIPFIKFPREFINEVTGAMFFAMIICLAALVVTLNLRDRVPTIDINHMSVKARWLSWQIVRSFDVKTVADVLGFDNRTRYGFEMPEIVAFVDGDCNSGWLAIENMGGSKTIDDDKTVKRLSGLLKGRFIQRFSFVSCDLSRDGNFYFYHFEDTKTSQRFVVKDGNIKPFISANTDNVALSKDLIWHTRLTAHLSIIARTRGGKSTFTGSYLIPLLKAQGWKVYLFSVKNDRYIKKYHGLSDPEKIVSKLEDLVGIMKAREDAIAEAGKDTSAEMAKMPNVAIIIDEIARLNSVLESKENKLLLERWNNVTKALTGSGASSGFHVIAMSQRGTKDGFFKNGTAVTNVSDAVIMLGLAADSGKDRETLMAGFEIPHRSYGCGQGIARIVTSGRKWEEPHFYETPLIL